MVYISQQSVAHRNIYTIAIPLHDPSGSLNPHILTDASRTDGRGRSLNLLTPPTSSLDPSFDPFLESESDSGSPGTHAVGAASSKCREPETESKSGSSGWNATAPIASPCASYCNAGLVCPVSSPTSPSPGSRLSIPRSYIMISPNWFPEANHLPVLSTSNCLF